MVGQTSQRLLLVAIPVALVGVGFGLEQLDTFVPLRVSIQRTPASLPSSLVVRDGEVARGLPLLSVYTSQALLHDPERGLLTNTRGRGREWEVPATVSYYDEGRLLFAGNVGFRVHGGRSRVGSPVQSFRLHFRREYGSRQFVPGVLFDGRDDPLTTLIVHNDLRADGDGQWWHFVNPLAYDIARRLGAITPNTHPVRFFVNGDLQGVFVLGNRVRRPFMEARYGHNKFLRADREIRRGLRRAIAAMQPLTMEKVDALIDLDNLSRWFMSIVFSATTDPFQGELFRDETLPDAKWFWVNWDMDHSFMDLYNQARSTWGHNTFRQTLRKRPVESQIVTRLLAEDPAYQTYLARLFTDALNHAVTPAFLRERFEYYRDLAIRYGVEHLDYLETLEAFLNRRPGVLRGHVRRYVKRDPAYRVAVKGPEDVEFLIDGFPEATGYTGRFLGGQEIRVTLATARSDFSHWVVNGERVESPVLSHQVLAPTLIVAQFVADSVRTTQGPG